MTVTPRDEVEAEIIIAVREMMAAHNRSVRKAGGRRPCIDTFCTTFRPLIQRLDAPVVKRLPVN